VTSRPRVPPTDDQLQHEVQQEREGRLLHVAGIIAPTLEVAQALLAGESVPVELCNPDAIQRFGRRPGVQVTDRIQLHDLNTVPRPIGLNGTQPTPFALDLEAFLEADLELAVALLGDTDNSLLVQGGLHVLAGPPSVGKTTLVLDAVFHLCSARAWLGATVERPINVLLIENEGPQQKFQQKLKEKVAAWGEIPAGTIHVHTWRWAGFDFNDSESMERLMNFLAFWEIDLVVGDPLDTLGMKGIGSPEDTREFVKLLVPFGLGATTGFLFLHHLRKEASKSEIDEVTGAWGARLDTLMVLKGTESKDELRLSFPKLRWAEERPPVILGKLRAAKSFELLAEEVHAEVDDQKAETLMRRIVEALRKRGGILERPALALNVDCDTRDRTFQRALRLGLDRGLLASEKKGRKTTYSLTEASWE
jgi:hypothetical protein